ncbi:hypothetical protein AHMF7605_14375 [Adhaeribacter arboris]|uniref:Apea-like HEPN domain-containing protein n=1 Tax=Adhaeribacter arboris TaxID=2072846 RepID=A0A2T2YGL0_9BACT|nr:hypothetical protein [Adhaeribacter arboris]PSR54608.1 hypothetical protein AHMF7605_14375 [Adhaeribacter arboris]
MKAKLKLENKINIAILLEKLNEISTLNENNTVAFDAFEYEKLEWVFLALLEFQGVYSIEAKKNILQNTFRQLVLKKRFDKEIFYEILSNQIQKHNKQPEKHYYLLTSLSVKELPIRKLTVDNSQIIITGKNFPKKFRSHRNNIRKTHNDNDNYIKIVVATKGRDFKDAYEKAYRSLEVFRALLCLILNSNLELRFGSHSANPINKVRQGEFSTLHLENGFCADSSNYWFESNYKVVKTLELNAEKRIKLKTNIKWLIKRYNLCIEKHKNTLSKALNIYVSAFDESNKYICFLGAWTALETILKADQNELLIKRCTAMYSEEHKQVQKQILEGLRIYRNEFVHEGNNGLDPFVACFFIQEFIYNLIIRFNFKFAGFFNTIDEATMFLDSYNFNLKELKIRKKNIDKAINLKEKNMKS